MRTAPQRENITFFSGLAFQLDPSDELVSFMTAWLDSKIWLLRLRWQFTWEQEACWVITGATGGLACVRLDSCDLPRWIWRPTGALVTTWGSYSPWRQPDASTNRGGDTEPAPGGGTPRGSRTCHFLSCQLRRSGDDFANCALALKASEGFGASSFFLLTLTLQSRTDSGSFWACLRRRC